MNRLLLFICFVLLTGCKKGAETPDPLIANVSNNVSGGYNYKFYTSLEDYLQDKNAIAAGKADSGNSVTVNLDAAKNSENVYFDLYTDDYSVTNWPGDYVTLISDLKQHSLVFTRETFLDGFMRKYYLDGNKKETVWHAVDVLNNQGQSIWDPNSYHPLVKVTIRKDRTFILKNYYSNLDSITGTVLLSRDERCPEYSLILNSTMSHYLWLDYPAGHPHHGTRPIKDTAILGYNGSGYFVLVKEP